MPGPPGGWLQRGALGRGGVWGLEDQENHTWAEALFYLFLCSHMPGTHLGVQMCAPEPEWGSMDCSYIRPQHPAHRLQSHRCLWQCVDTHGGRGQEIVSPALAYCPQAPGHQCPGAGYSWALLCRHVLGHMSRHADTSTGLVTQTCSDACMNTGGHRTSGICIFPYIFECVHTHTCVLMSSYQHEHTHTHGHMSAQIPSPCTQLLAPPTGS